MREIYVDSRRRKEPYGNSYTLYIQNPLKNVTKVELVSATVPNTVYNITNGSNILSISGNVFSISNGFYSTSGLVDAVNNTVSSNAYTFSFLNNEGKFIMVSTNVFSMTILSQEFTGLTGMSGTLVSNLATTSNGIFMGPSSNAYYFVKAPRVATMKPWGEYVYLDINELRRPFEIDAVSDPTASQTSTIFAIIPLDVTSSYIKTFKEFSDYKISINYPKPIDIIDRLTVKWLDYKGNIVDFNGANDNAILLRFFEDDQSRVPLYEEKEKNIIYNIKGINVIMILVFSILFILLLKRR
jgi:hypothetical protein